MAGLRILAVEVRLQLPLLAGYAVAAAERSGTSWNDKTNFKMLDEHRDGMPVLLSLIAHVADVISITVDSAPAVASPQTPSSAACRSMTALIAFMADRLRWPAAASRRLKTAAAGVTRADGSIFFLFKNTLKIVWIPKK